MEEIEKPREYYSADSLLRYNALWNFILGERSCGKSFEFKRRSITTPDTIWIYLRRTDTDRKDPKNWKSYLSDLLLANKIDIDREYKCNSEGIWVDGMQKVIFSALSVDSSAHSMTYLPDTVAPKQKKNSKKKNKKDEEVDADYDKIIDKINEAEYSNDSKNVLKKKIVFEEFIEPKGRYLKNEVEQLFEFYNTVDRYTNTNLYGIANLMSSYNPYFEYFGIRPFHEEFKWYKNKTLLVQNVKIKGMEEYVKSRKFYNLVSGTSYGEYLVNNSPWQDDNAFIEKRPGDSSLIYNIKMHGEYYGIWEKEGLFYVSKKHNLEYPTFSGLKSREGNELVIRRGEYAHKFLSNCIEDSTIRYDSVSIRDMCYDVVNGGYKDG